MQQDGERHRLRHLGQDRVQTQGGQPSLQPGTPLWNGWKTELKANPTFEGGAPGPTVRPPQGEDFLDAEVLAVGDG